MAIPTSKKIVSEMFHSVDTDNNGTISPWELKMAMQKASIHFDTLTSRMMIGMFDKSGMGNLNLAEFTKLFEFQDKWQTRFFLKDNSGTVDRKQFVEVLRALGYFLSHKAIDDLLYKYDSHRYGKIVISDFMKCGVLLNAIDSAYRQRDTDQGREITISFEELLMLIVTKILL